MSVRRRASFTAAIACKRNVVGTVSNYQNNINTHICKRHCYLIRVMNRREPVQYDPQDGVIVLVVQIDVLVGVACGANKTCRPYS
jgi:hypothetical protein